MIVFARTKSATEELAAKLQARGLAAAAINGDIEQKQRERTIARLKDGDIDVLVATDVAARGLDVERISHVLNYDIPYDTESYVHRIGRTGRAGRSGEAILFVTPREKGMLRAIERATRQPIEEMKLPSVDAVNDVRVARFLGRIGDTLAGAEDNPDELALFRDLIARYQREHDVPALEIAAALAKLLQGGTPLLLAAEKAREPRESFERPARAERPPRADRPERAPRVERPRKDIGPRGAPEAGMETYRIEVGHAHGVKPGNIVGAIANEADLESRFIGRIDIHDDHSILDLPEGMPRELLMHLQKVRVAGQALRLHPVGAEGGAKPSYRPQAGGANPPGARPPHRKGPGAARPRPPKPHGG
jgi:ATP-dependent RNA helicase DeaD